MRRSYASQAFTLLEVILAIAVGSIVLCSASYYLYSLTLLYSETVRAPRFEEHADTVAMFLEDAFNTASAQGGNASASKPIFWVEPSFGHQRQPLLSFKTNTDIGIATSSGAPAQPLQIALIFDDKFGLILALQRQSELRTYPDRVQYIALSALVSQVSYAYYDADNNSWEIVEEPNSDINKLPKALEITFEDQGNETRRWIYLPTFTRLPAKKLAPASETSSTARTTSSKQGTEVST